MEIKFGESDAVSKMETLHGFFHRIRAGERRSIRRYQNPLPPHRETSPMLSTGEPAPSFELENQQGKTVRLADYEGQYVVVYFYPRADTPGCTTEACSFRDNWEAYQKQNVPVLGISDDPIPDLADFSAKYDLPFDLLSDPNGSVATRYDSYGTKMVFGNEVEGTFRNTYVIGPNGTIVAAFENVDPDAHATTVLERIE